MGLFWAFGLSGQSRDRTGDTWIFSPLLYQLSYLPAIGTGEYSPSRGRAKGAGGRVPVVESPRIGRFAVPVPVRYRRRRLARMRDSATEDAWGARG